MFKLAQERDADKILVDMLCVAYAKELKAYHGYLHAYVTVTGPLESVYGEIYEAFMKREMHHLEEVGKKIVAMGGMPPTEYPSIDKVAAAIYKGYDETLAALQDAEVETLEMYKKIHATADKVGDLPLVLLIEEIMQEEEEHHDELQRILIDVPGKHNVEMHDELEVDAFEIRSKKIAELMNLPPIKNEVDMNRYAGRWMKINKDIVKLLNEMGINEDDVGIIDYNDEAYLELLRNLMKQRDAIQEQLNGYDSSWLISYMEDESKEEKPLPNEGKQEKQHEGVRVRKKKLADLFIVATSHELKDYSIKQLQDERDKLLTELKASFVPQNPGEVMAIHELAPELQKRYNEIMQRLKSVYAELEKRYGSSPRPQPDESRLKPTDEDAPPTINDSNMESYIKKWIKLNNEMRDIEDEYGEMEEEDMAAPPEYKRMARERKNIQRALDDFDGSWMRDYFGDEESMDEVEAIETMRDYR